MDMGRPDFVERSLDVDAEALVADAEARFALHPRALSVLLTRGICEQGAIDRHLDPRLGHLRSPDGMGGFGAALELLADAVRRRARVGVFGDYDVDGVTTATILSHYLRSAGLDVVTRVAARETGYGFSIAHAQAFAAAGVELVLLGDCGTSDHDALAEARRRGLRSIVIDHHQVPATMPPCDALINPHQRDCGFPFKGLCSAGVAFYLCAALRTRLVKLGIAAADPRWLLDLVALGTVCDMMPLRDENRVLVRQGLRVLERRARPGIHALAMRAKIGDHDPIDVESIGFRLGPRLNAPGRLGTAEPALALLCASTSAEAFALAEQVEGFNAKRRSVQRRVLAEAMKIAEQLAEIPAGLVIAAPGWPAGIVGIVANALVERFARPVAVVAIDLEAGEARGSVRSYGGVDVRAALEHCSAWLMRYGGHKEAAGFSVCPSKLDDFTRAFADAVGRVQTGEGKPKPILIDGCVSLQETVGRLVTSLDRVGPFGVAFDEPSFVCEAARVERVRVLKDKHLALAVSQAGHEREAIAFSQPAPVPRPGDNIGFMFAPVLETFRGRTTLRLVIERWWPT